MKISFWSPVHGQTGNTSNMVAVSIMACILQQKKVAVMQSHFSMNNLSQSLIGTAGEGGQFMDRGIDALMRDFKARPLTEEIILSDSLSLLNRQYNLFAGTGKLNRDTFETELMKSFNPIVKKINTCHDMVFVDVNSGYSKCSQKILSASDLIVVNLSQNKSMVEKYINNCLDHPNIIYLFGNYNYHSKYNIKNFRRMHPLLKTATCCNIYYNSEYLDAINDGKTIEYIMKNQSVSDTSDNYDFIRSVKNVVATIIKRGEKIGENN